MQRKLFYLILSPLAISFLLGILFLSTIYSAKIIFLLKIALFLSQKNIRRDRPRSSPFMESILHQYLSEQNEFFRGNIRYVFIEVKRVFKE